MPLVPVILCGGAGSRLWPVSRELHPKPFIRLADGQSLLQKAFLRAAAQPGVDAILTVTNRELFFKTRDEYREVDDKVSTSFVLEPFGRGTAAAVACAALHVAQAQGAGAILLVLPADHLIEKADAFAAAVARAMALAREGRLVTFGIRPAAPETGYGYIEAEGERESRFRRQQSRAVGVPLPYSRVCVREASMREEILSAATSMWPAVTAPESVNAPVLVCPASPVGEADGPTPALFKAKRI